MSSLKAEVAIVKIGNLEMEGLMDEYKCYYVAVPQLVALNLVSPDKSAKRLEPQVGIALESIVIKLKTPLNSKDVNGIPLIYFEEILFNLALKKVQAAINLSRLLIGASLTKLFSIAFKQKFEDDDFQEYFEARQAGIKTRRNLTHSIDDWHKANICEKAPGLLYAITTNKIYRKLYGKDAKDLELLLGCPRYKSRTVMDKESLVVIDRAESKVMEGIDYEGYNPITAVDKVKIYPAKSLPFRRDDLN